MLLAHLLSLSPESADSPQPHAPKSLPRATDFIFLWHASGKTTYHHKHHLSTSWVSWHPFPMASDNGGCIAGFRTTQRKRALLWLPKASIFSLPESELTLGPMSG